MLNNRIDFMVIFTARNCNPNGDPVDHDIPRTNFDGYGLVSDMCLKRKIRNRLEDMGEKVLFPKTKVATVNADSLVDRVLSVQDLQDEFAKGKNTDIQKCAEISCREWIDVRAFGLVFPINNKKVVNFNVRGAITIGDAMSLERVEIQDKTVVKTINLEKAGAYDSATMGSIYTVKKGVYVAQGAINQPMAEKNGLTETDAELIHQAFITLFKNDASASRPDGSMEVTHVYWWVHPNKDGLCSSAKVFRTIKLTPQEEYPYYTVEENPIDGLVPDVYVGINN